MADDPLNPFAAFRFLLGYPDERHLDLFRASGDAPATLDELRSTYISLFEAGMPRPACPLLESAYVLTRPPGEIVLENKLFYKHFGLEIRSDAAPDHLLTQLEFLSWLEYRKARCTDAAIDLAREDFLSRRLRPWIGKAAALADRAEGACYAQTLRELAAAIGN